MRNKDRMEAGTNRNRNNDRETGSRGGQSKDPGPGGVNRER